MKTLMLFIALLVMGTTGQAQPPYAIFTEGLQPGCAEVLTISTDATFSYSLVMDDTVVTDGTIEAGASAALSLTRADQWYILNITTSGIYTIDAAMDCSPDNEGDAQGADPQQAEHEAELRAIFEKIAPELQAGLLRIFGK